MLNEIKLNKWLLNDEYPYPPKGKFYLSASGLCKPVRQLQLLQTPQGQEEAKQKNKERTPRQNLASSVGTAIHNSLKALYPPPERMEIQLEDNLFITGEPDYIEKLGSKYLITDFKTGHSFTRGDTLKAEEYKRQLSIYKWLFAKTNNLTDDDFYPFGHIEHLWLDHRESFDFPCTEKDTIVLYSLQEIEDIILQAASFVKYGPWQQCSPEERWFRPLFSVTKEGASRARKNFNNRALAEEYLSTISDKSYYVEDKTTYARCDKFCNVCECCKKMN